jgi:hypothetical protein
MSANCQNSRNVGLALTSRFTLLPHSCFFPDMRAAQLVILSVALSSTCHAIFNCTESGSGCGDGLCTKLGAYSVCECSSGYSGVLCQYSSNCNDSTGRCDGACLASGLCNCTNGLVGSHCNHLPTSAGFVYDSIRQMVEPCKEGALLLLIRPIFNAHTFLGHFNTEPNAGTCQPIAFGSYPIDNQGR